MMTPAAVETVARAIKVEVVESVMMMGALVSDDSVYERAARAALSALAAPAVSADVEIMATRLEVSIANGGPLGRELKRDCLDLLRRLDAERRAVPDEVAAEREACAKLIERFMTPESGPNYGLMDDPERRDVRQANRTYATLAAAIRSRAGGDRRE